MQKTTHTTHHTMETLAVTTRLWRGITLILLTGIITPHIADLINWIIEAHYIINNTLIN